MLRKTICLIVAITCTCTGFGPVPVLAQGLLGLPEPGVMVALSPAYEPALIKGLTVHKENPFLFDFIVDTGNSELSGNALRSEGDRLIKYFFAALTIPDKNLWVNLSPYEKDRMIPQALGKTAMGRDLLAQDYMLKQVTASLIYPGKGLGKDFWDTIYAQAREQYGTTDVPVNTFNKVWIVAQKASVYEHNQTAFIVSGHLKVMLEEDYLASLKQSEKPHAHTLASHILRSIILPALEHEVNTGKNFATLRQIFYSQILATWFKRNLKQALLSQVYADKSTVQGVDLKDLSVRELIYQRYLQAYKKGAFNFIREDRDPLTQVSAPKKYFSGGYASAIALNVDRASSVQLNEAARPTGMDVDFTTSLNLNQPYPGEVRPIEILFKELERRSFFPWFNRPEVKRQLGIYLSNPLDHGKNAQDWRRREMDFWLLIPKEERPVPRIRGEILDNIQYRYEQIVGEQVIKTLRDNGNLLIGGRRLNHTEAIAVYLKDRDEGKAVLTLRQSFGIFSDHEDFRLVRILTQAVNLYHQYRVAATSEEISRAARSIANLIKGSTVPLENLKRDHHRRGVNYFTEAALKTSAEAILVDRLVQEGLLIPGLSRQSLGSIVLERGERNQAHLYKYSVTSESTVQLGERLESIERQGKLDPAMRATVLWRKLKHFISSGTYVALQDGTVVPRMEANAIYQRLRQIRPLNPEKWKRVQELGYFLNPKDSQVGSTNNQRAIAKTVDLLKGEDLLVSPATKGKNPKLRPVARDVIKNTFGFTQQSFHALFLDPFTGLANTDDQDGSALLENTRQTLDIIAKVLSAIEHSSGVKETTVLWRITPESRETIEALMLRVHGLLLFSRPGANELVTNRREELKAALKKIKAESEALRDVLSKKKQNPSGPSPAMASSTDFNKGGIDLNALDGGLSVTKNGGGVSITIDPALLAEVQREGISHATPVIVQMKVLTSLHQLLGL